MTTMKVLAQHGGFVLTLGLDNNTFLSYDGRTMQVEYAYDAIRMIPNDEARSAMAKQLFGGK